MNESIKATLGVIIAACALAGIVAWLPGPTNEISTVTWWFRIGCPILGVVCLAPLIWAQTRKDKAPNFLSRITPRYFERDGFCFALVPQVTNGKCSMQIYFQDRYDQPCSAQILIRASSGLFSGRPDLSDMTLGLTCGPAEFGCSTIPWTIPENLQGKTVALSLYAGVKISKRARNTAALQRWLARWRCWNRCLARGASNCRRYWRRTYHFPSCTH